MQFFFVNVTGFPRPPHTPTKPTVPTKADEQEQHKKESEYRSFQKVPKESSLKLITTLPVEKRSDVTRTSIYDFIHRRIHLKREKTEE